MKESPSDHRTLVADDVREEDLEPYVALRYIARLFKILAVLILVMLLGEATRLLVMAGLLWAAGDIAVLLVDAGHDVRVTRILLGRIHARLGPPAPAAEAAAERTEQQEAVPVP